MHASPLDTAILRKRNPTIIDVAAVAGVAIGTVSRHLNGLPVRASNRDQIERAIAELGYRRNSIAVSMKTDTTHIVGLMMPAISEFHASLLDQLSRKMRQSGRAVLTFCHDQQLRTIQEGLEFFASHRVDAVVMDGEPHLRQAVLKHIEDGLVVVLYDNDIEDLPVDRVFSANRAASARAVDHLIDLGHKRIATIHGHLRDSAARERLAGFVEAHEHNGLEIIPELVVDAGWQQSKGYDALRTLMALEAPPTALFSANYNMTIGALIAARELGLRIPEDLSVVSFDDVPAFSVHNPGITCVGQPIERLAETITTVLSQRLADPAGLGRRLVTIDCDIILRGSTRRLRT
ncbi:LacI family DNA-binding transcriptional regulator [Devosia sp. XGJD_8]|uniref:LacI family DNA-binding transcriptional regulator n=1 Tax=Devosia sp. XGJD_8 TaxID=3391187 RepID=UPI003985265C